MIFFFFFNDTATTEIYTLSLHDALPISGRLAISSSSSACRRSCASWESQVCGCSEVDTVISSGTDGRSEDRKSTRLNSSHANISYAVFCLKKKQKLARAYMSTPIGIFLC